MKGLKPPRFTSDELLAAARADYISKGWSVPGNLSKGEEKLASQLARRFEFLAKHDGMEHLVYVTGRVTDSTYKLHKQVLFDIDLAREFCHVVLVCEEKISKADENMLRAWGVGVLLIRQDASPLVLLHPRLRCFREPNTYDLVPQGIRNRVRTAVNKIVGGDVCIGVLDLAQILESRIKHPSITALTLGGKINQARANNLLSASAASAAFRVNVPRIKRAHPRGHGQRRQAIVMRVQSIVDDCLAVLCALP